jgi:hypothetical protein
MPAPQFAPVPSQINLVNTLQAYVFKMYEYVIQYPWASDLSEWVSVWVCVCVCVNCVNFVNCTHFQYLPLLLRSVRHTGWGRSDTFFNWDRRCYIWRTHHGRRKNWASNIAQAYCSTSMSELTDPRKRLRSSASILLPKKQKGSCKYR